MIASAILGLLQQNQAQGLQKKNAEEEATRQHMLQRRAATQQTQQAATQNGHIDMQSIIDGVFTGGNKNKSSLPSGYLGV